MINSSNASVVQCSGMQRALMVRISPSTPTQSAVKSGVRDVWVLCLVLDVWVFFLTVKKSLDGNSKCMSAH